MITGSAKKIDKTEKTMIIIGAGISVIALMLGYRLYALGVVPVSYTHLDVYKRQEKEIIYDILGVLKNLVGRKIGTKK